LKSIVPQGKGSDLQDRTVFGLLCQHRLPPPKNQENTKKKIMKGKEQQNRLHTHSSIVILVSAMFVEITILVT
jgi:hypothetical protein